MPSSQGPWFVFSAGRNAKKEEIKAIEDKYAEMGIPVVSNNSVTAGPPTAHAHR